MGEIIERAERLAQAVERSAEISARIVATLDRMEYNLNNAINVLQDSEGA